MTRGRIARITASLFVAMTLSLIVSSDAAASTLPPGDLSGITSIAKSLLTALSPGNGGGQDSYFDLDDIPADEPGAEDGLGDLGIPAPPVFEGPRGYVEGQSREIVEERTEKSKTFANPDGTRTTNFYAGPMH